MMSLGKLLHHFYAPDGPESYSDAAIKETVY